MGEAREQEGGKERRQGLESTVQGLVAHEEELSFPNDHRKQVFWTLLL